MKVITFNTMCAPTMPNRLIRQQKINQRVLEWLDDDVDIIGLQEYNGYAIGICGIIFYKYILNCYILINNVINNLTETLQISEYLTFISHIIHQIMRLVDLLLIIEGYIMPISVYDNTKSLKDLISKDYLVYTSKIPKRGVSSGLVLIINKKTAEYTSDGFVRNSLNAITHIDKGLTSDVVHKPGILAVIIGQTIITNVHFTPKLIGGGLVYKIVRNMNKFYGYDINEIRKTNIHEMYDVINHYIDLYTERKNNQYNVYSLGDYNIGRIHEPELYKLLTSNSNIDSAPNPTISIKDLYGCEDTMVADQLDQIDYILSNAVAKKYCASITLDNLSDHLPLVSIF
jgi:hypothetical protein